MLLISVYCHGEVDFSSQQIIDDRKKESIEGLANGLKRAQAYDLPHGCQHKDITHDLMQSKETSKDVISLIETQQRKFILFSYPSDEYQVKAVISYTPHVNTAPLLMLLRGGTGFFGLRPPADSLRCFGNYTVLAPTYRGGVSGGFDEYGGGEVNDVKNLVDYLPQLATALGIIIQPQKKYILGASRGGMEMFLALQRYPCLQDYFDKCVSLSGICCIRTLIKSRTEMKDMFIEEFGLKDENDDAWITHRSPIEHCQKLKANFPILIIQGTEDNRVSLSEGRDMVKTLKELKRNVTYWEIEGATHCWRNDEDARKANIMTWLDQEEVPRVSSASFKPKFSKNAF